MGETRTNSVAVIGMSCRLPGGIVSPEQLWEALLRGDDFVTEVPAERWDAEQYYDPEPGVPGRSVSKWGAFLDDVAGFDADFFGITDREATAIDPQHRLLLETAWEAVEHAGLNPTALSGSKAGVFMGVTHNDYAYLAADTQTLEGPYGFTGTSFSLASGRIAYALGVHGPAYTVDTACSSGLSAIHMACRSLQDGESDLALAGGVSVLLEPRKAAGGSAAGMLSPTGHCRAFDEAADGFVSAEGCVVLTLKRLDDALEAGDRIMAVIRGTAVNQDGRTVNIATPSSEAQIKVYRAALAAAGVEAGTVGLVEAHGTGTPVGDPLEYASVAEVYGSDGPCALASVKTNFGHTQSAAGALGVMKAVLAVQHGVIPPNLHFNRLPDELTRIETHLFVPQSTTAFPTNGQQPRRAAVSAYGLSGTNAHAIVEQPPEPVAPQRPAEVSGPLLFPLSSTSAGELRRTAGNLADWLAKSGDGNGRGPAIDLFDLGYTLSRRRGHRSVRTSVIAGGREELISALRDVADGESPYEAAVGQDDRGPVWVFSGQGSQWAGMGAELLAREPVFANTVAELEELIQRESDFSVTQAMSAPQTVTGINQVQPTVFAVQVALAATMKSYGVTPGAVIGHSMGEVAAAVVAGALTLEDGVKVICRRSKLMARIAGSGAMASVELPASQVLSELAARGVTDVSLAVVASPQSTVIGGATESVRDLVAGWEQRDVMAREVAVDVASHSPQVDPILDELEEVLSDLDPMEPEIPYYSATLYDPRDEPEWDAYYWVDNLRHTVRFAAAVQAALEDGFRVFGELSPHPLLTHAVDQTARGLDIPLTVLAAMRRDQQLPFGLRPLVADVHNAGAAVDFSVLYPAGRLVDAPLPTWTHESLLLDRDGQDATTRGGCTVSVHPLLGSHVVLPEEPERHVWQGEVGTEAQPWLGDHQVHEVAVLPGAAYCEMALAAARTVLGDTAEVRDIVFEQMLMLDETTPISATASALAPGILDFAVETYEAGERTRRAHAVLHAEVATDEGAHDIDTLLTAHADGVDGADLRAAFGALGIQHGPAFSGLATAYTADGPAHTVLAVVALPGPLRAHQGAYGVHPALLDACFQSVLAHPVAQNAAVGGMLLPLGVRRLRVNGSARNAHYCYSRIVKADAEGIEADLDILDERGAILLSLEGLRLGTGASQKAQADRVLNERLLSIEWHQRELPEADSVDAGSWLLIKTSGNGDILTAALGDALKAAGAECSTMAWPQHADHQSNTELLMSYVGEQVLTGVVVVPDLADGDAGAHASVRGGDHVRHLVRIIRELPEAPGEPPRLYVVTRNAQSVVADDVPNLEHAGLRGFIRAIGMEHPRLRASQIDIDEATGVEQLARQLLTGSDEDETAWRDGQWYTARLSPAPLRADERYTATASNQHDGMRLQIRTPGDLESLEMVSSERVPPGPGQIEVAVSASSINFVDVLVAFGRCPSFDGRLPELGSEFGGVVTAVGPGVTTHQVGDRVGGVSANGCWGNYVICEANLATKLPDGLEEHHAAAVGLAYGTVWLGLQELARISSTDKVLIHSATGGVGQAAIAVARAAGAEIYATAGSEARRQLLRDWGIEHVYDSRSTEFADQIRRDTDGYGVDIVLNSVTGAAQRAGLELLAFGGRFLEIGKRDIYGDTRVGLFPFRRNLSFYAIDLALMTVTHPDKVRGLLEKVYQLTADGSLPLPDITRYPLAEAASAIRQIGGAQHIGKLVLDVSHSGTTEVMVPPEEAPTFRSDGAYIVTGGLGGLGLFLAEKMAEQGCGRIVLTSRSKPSVKAQEIVELIRSTGADIVVECGDIAAEGTAERLVAAATATGLPLRGVLHAAAVVEDATLPNITDDLVERDWAPKVYGVWNLHRATQGQPLDWFCSFSSAAALVGSPGQGAYAAANSWLDAFTRWRRAQGLPASAIAWGAWGEIGRGTALAENDAAILPDEGAYAFESLLRYDRVYTGYAPILGTPWLTAFAQRSPFASAFKSASQSSSEGRKLRAELAALPRDEWPTHLRRLISEQVGLILRRAIDPDRPLSEYGLDSLGNLELRTRIEAETGIRITAMGVNTVRALADSLCETLAADDTVAASS
ncbi:sulfolipid-1 biosynthesis phthioceranic/hydroxyphthioceranic acid synthase [Mycolicibacterium elephantis]|uniref:sulfolipid-1 biosynthesis phthioceranic/hydroxyphthioceranic acid synthase n=1 Tax=Mycolicibacterium elephantis TaxID=81858 RepID=UPI0021F29D38|nr:sulfolipid-1 biosynthesis phthioceranic/hydroxyphthioceranic acid synthase [Mycolicibacterium elephantis]